MADPFADWPKDEVAATDERSALLRFLDYQRAVLGRKAMGLSEQQAKLTSCPPSGLTMLGLVRHLSGVERWWSRSVTGSKDFQLHSDSDTTEGDFFPPPDATLAEALESYWGEVAAADDIFATADLEDRQRNGGIHNVRWILIHLVEEYARHCGHADLLREAIDGAVGD